MSLDLPPGLDVLDLKKPTPENVPKQRLSDPSKACELVELLIYANRERAQVDARVKGMLDGNAPFSHASLKREGQGQRTNVNFREGEAMMMDAMTPFYDLFAESDTYCKIIVDEEDNERRTRWSRIVTEEFDLLAKEWSGFDWNMQAILYDMVAFGKGFAFWPDKTGWQFQGIRQSRVLVPDQTPSDPDQLEVIVVLQDCTVGALYNYVRDEKMASRIGWKPRAVLEACARAMPVNDLSKSPIDWELAQQELRNHDLYEAVRSSVVSVANIFVKEFDGRVSHLIVEQRYGNTTGKVPNGVFLYKKIGRYDSFRSALAPVFYDIGDGTWHSIKGLAIKLYPFIEIKNRLNCSVIDNAFLNMSVLVKPNTAQAAEGAAIMHLGPLSILPPNVEVAQWGLTGRMEEGLAVERALTGKLESNLGQYRKPLLEKQGNPVTATQVTYDAAKEASLSKGAVNRFYVQMDMLFEQMVKRAVNPNLVSDNGGQNDCAIRFQERCIKRGVPKSRLVKPRSVRASRNIGNGSIFLRQQTMLQTAPMVPMFNEAGRQNWLDDSIAVMAGTEAVERWNPRTPFSSNLSDEQAWAVLENAALKERAPVRWTPTQNNSVHAGTHLKAAMDALGSLNPGNGNQPTGNPMEVLGFIDAVGPHIAIHLQQMQRDPAQVKMFKQFSIMFKELMQRREELNKHLQRMAIQQNSDMKRRAQRQQQVMTDAQMDQIELQSKLRNQDMKTQEALRLKQEKHTQNMMLADASTASKIQRSNIETAAKLANERRNGEEE